jgi:hypothetical protein
MGPMGLGVRVCGGILGGGFVGFDCFVGFRVFRGFLDGGVDRYGAKAAKGRKGRWSFGVSEFRSFGVSEFRSFGVSEFRSFGVSEFRSFGVSEFRSFGGAMDLVGAGADG